MTSVFYAGQKDYIEKLNALSLAESIVDIPTNKAAAEAAALAASGSAASAINSQGVATTKASEAAASATSAASQVAIIGTAATIQGLANTATTQAALATTNGAVQVTLAAAEKTAAQTARTAAESARDAAQLSAGVYATPSAGVAATTTGKYFSSPSPDSNEYLILYLNNAGVAVEQKRYPSKSAIDAIPLAQHIGLFDGLSVVDEAGNAAFVVDVGGITTELVNSLNPVAGATPIQHISLFEQSWIDESGNIGSGIDGAGTQVAKRFEMPDGNAVGSNSLDLKFHATPYAQIDAIVALGQSNMSGGVPTMPPVSQSQPYNNIMPLYGTAGNPSAGQAGTNPLGFTPLLAGPSEQEWGAIAGVNKVTAMILRDSNLTPAGLTSQIYTFNSAGQGEEIPQLGNEGTALKLKRDILHGYNFAAAMGKSFNFQAVWFSQGESQAADATATYLAKELAMYQWINDWAKATLAQKNNVKLFTWQLCEPSGVGFAHAKAAAQHPNIHVCFPKYACRATVGNGGHFNAIGMAQASAYFGVAYKRIVVDGTGWEPLTHRSIEVRARRVFVAYNRKGLVLDYSTFPQQAGGGFYASDDGGVLTLSNVAVSDFGLVSFTVNRDITGALTVGYGVPMTGRADDFNGPTSLGGNLRDCDGLIETVDISGATYPLHNFSLLFKEVL